jgi:uncharacterized membrane protein
VPFAAYTLDSESPLAIVTQVNSEAIQLYQKDFNKPITQTKEEFIKKWNGVYLIAEPSEHSGEVNYTANKQQAFLKSLVPAAVIGILIIFSLFLLNKIAGTELSAIGMYLQYFILLAGVIVTSLLVWYEIDKSNPLLQKVCTGIVKGNCNAILTGKQAKVFSWLSWSEVGFFYFAGSLLVILGASKGPAPIFAIAWLNLLALPYTIFSVYYQWRVAKQWCVLCLAVQALLVVGAVNVIASNFLFSLPQFPFLLIANSLLLFLLPALLWFTIKPYILSLQQAKNTKREYLRIKFNTEIFNTLLKKQKALTTPADGLGINLGNPAATNSIIKVCNPYCGPCAKVHPKIDALLEQIPNLKAQIIFNTTNNEQDRGGKPVKHLLAIAASDNTENMIKQSLDDWYLADTKDYEQFAAKYPMNGELLKQGDKIAAMEKWCKAAEIAFTPTIFINGYQLPDAYSVEDLQYFLLE